MFQEQLRKTLYYYIDNDKNILKYFTDLLKLFKLMFICEENYPSKGTCTDLDNMMFSFDIDGDVYPCHAMNEMYYDKGCDYKASNIVNLKQKIKQEGLYMPLNKSEEYEYFKQRDRSNVCLDCIYSYDCYLEKWHKFNYLCMLNKFVIRNNLEPIQKSTETYFCINRYFFDLIFECINSGRISINDIIQL